MRERKSKKLPKVAKVSNAAQIPFDMAVCYPYIRMCFNREIIIEDAGKLVHYDMENVRVMQRKNTVSVTGRNLKIVFLANGDLRVTGFVTNVGFE
ncbi:MAG: YabP/YqfC family sporulation protein [Clostridia bacterium]|nr:YabP/YqfC family sporulation protein [Clostridia bacterium]